jgi:hypothetical protein
MAVETRAASAPSGEERPFGPAAAVLLATGVGALVLGILTTINEASEGVHDFLEFSGRVGPLSGKTIIAGAVFFGSWGVLAWILGHKNPPFKATVVATAILLAIGFVMTFPVFFQAFA